VTHVARAGCAGWCVPGDPNLANYLWDGFLARFDVDASRLLTARRVMAAFWL
jgi:hypothetical protein